MLTPKHLRLENWVCAALLAASALLFVAPFPWRGGVPVEMDGLLGLSPWSEARPPGTAAGSAGEIGVTAQRYYPWHAHLRRAVQSRELPLWNPHEGFGAPFFAVWRTRVLSPFSLPFYLFFLPLTTAFSLSILLKLMVAGWMAYYAARRLALAPPFALLVGIAYQSGAPLLGLAAEPIADAMPWFPLVLFWTQCLLVGSPGAWPRLGGVLALIALGGSPETLTAVLLFLLVLPVAYRLRTRHIRSVTGVYAGLAGATVLCLALVAVQWLPYVEYRSESLPTMASSFGTLPAADLSAFLLAPLRTHADTPARAVQFLHPGMVAALLSALWFAVRPHAAKRRRRLLETLLAASGLFLLIPLCIGRLLESGHGLPLPRSEHFLVPWALAWAFLAAAAAEEWIHLDAAGCKAALRRFFMALGVLLAVFVLAGGLSLRMRGMTAGPAVWAALLCALAVAALVVATAVRPSPRLLGYGLCLAVLLSGLWALGPVRHFTPAASVFPGTTFIAALREAESRVAGSGALKAWPLAAHGIPQVHNPAGITLRRYRQFMDAAEGNPAIMRRGAAGALLLTRQDIQGAYAALRPTLNIQEVFPSGAILLRDLAAKPRARMIYAGRRVDRFNPDLLKMDGLPQIEGGQLPDKDGGPAAEAVIIPPERSNRVAVRTGQTRPGVLVLADAWYPGWRATVDGEPAVMVPVDGLFRGVEVGEGAHEVVFEFRPLSVRAGFWISMGGLVILLVLTRPARKRD